MAPATVHAEVVQYGSPLHQRETCGRCGHSREWRRNDCAGLILHTSITYIRIYFVSYSSVYGKMLKQLTESFRGALSERFLRYVTVPAPHISSHLQSFPTVRGEEGREGGGGEGGRVAGKRAGGLDG